MALSTPLSTASASPASTSSDEQRLGSGGEATVSAARAILNRHTEQRQRFDSADYAMRCSAAAGAESSESRQRTDDNHCHRAPDEHEPEPEVARQESTGVIYPPQQVRRIRLQRFDSADWVMDALKASSSEQEPSDATSVDAAASTGASESQHAVAKLLLDRHAYATCHFVTTPVEKRELCTERAA